MNIGRGGGEMEGREGGREERRGGRGGLERGRREGGMEGRKGGTYR